MSEQMERLALLQQLMTRAQYCDCCGTGCDCGCFEECEKHGKSTGKGDRMTWARRCYTSPGYRRWWLSKRREER